MEARIYVDVPGPCCCYGPHVQPVTTLVSEGYGATDVTLTLVAGAVTELSGPGL